MAEWVVLTAVRCPRGVGVTFLTELLLPPELKGFTCLPLRRLHQSSGELRSKLSAPSQILEGALFTSCFPQLEGQGLALPAWWKPWPWLQSLVSGAPWG